MSREQQSALLSNCLLNAVAAADADYSVSIVAALNATMTLIAAQAGTDKAKAWASFDACVAALTTGMAVQYGPRPDPSVN